MMGVFKYRLLLILGFFNLASCTKGLSVDVKCLSYELNGGGRCAEYGFACEEHSDMTSRNIGLYKTMQEANAVCQSAQHSGK